MELESLSADYLSLISGRGWASTGGAAPFSDVTFCVEGRHISAHRCILAARSPFFKLMFSHHTEPPSVSHHPPSTSFHPRPPTSALPNLFVPLDVVGSDVFLVLLRFLYSGQLNLSPPLSAPSSSCSSSRCPLPSCPHSSCSYAVDLLLQLIPAAHFFGVHQLADLAQSKLGSVLEEGGLSMESLMRVLTMAKNHKMQHLWRACADSVIKSGLDCSVMQRFLPREVVTELAETRLQRSACMQSDGQIYRHVDPPQHLSHSQLSGCSVIYHRVDPPQHLSHSQLSGCSVICSTNAEACCSDEQKILRLQQALDCMDVELVRLMVMGEGLNLDKALALHYSVANCNREVVKALLELGVVDVNYTDSLGRTALHLAADMGSAEMIAVLLDHHADPNMLTLNGFAAVDILRGLIKAGSQDHFHRDQQPIIFPPLCKADQKRIYLCIELLQSASAVAGREEAAESSCVTQAAAQIFDTRLNHEAARAAAFMAPCCPGVLLDAGVAVSSCGSRLSMGSEAGLAAAAVQIVRSHDQICGTANGTARSLQSTQFDEASCYLHQIEDNCMNSITAPYKLPAESLAISFMPPAGSWPMSKIKRAASISSSEDNHFTDHAQMTHQMSVISGETSSLISPRPVNHNVNHSSASYTSAAGAEGYKDVLQNAATTETASTNHVAAQGRDGKPAINAGTSLSSEE